MSITNGQSIVRDKPYQNRIKTGAIFEDLLLSQEKAGGQDVGAYHNRIKTPSVEAVELAD